MVCFGKTPPPLLLLLFPSLSLYVKTDKQCEFPAIIHGGGDAHRRIEKRESSILFEEVLTFGCLLMYSTQVL